MSNLIEEFLALQEKQKYSSVFRKKEVLIAEEKPEDQDEEEDEDEEDEDEEEEDEEEANNMRNEEAVEFSEEEIAHIKSILEAMPVAPTAEGHAPNPTPKNKAEGGKGRGSLSEKMDPVGKEDKDVNNDGKVGPEDEYIMNRRNAIKKNMEK